MRLILALLFAGIIVYAMSAVIGFVVTVLLPLIFIIIAFVILTAFINYKLAKEEQTQ